MVSIMNLCSCVSQACVCLRSVDIYDRLENDLQIHAINTYISKELQGLSANFEIEPIVIKHEITVDNSCINMRA